MMGRTGVKGGGEPIAGGSWGAAQTDKLTVGEALSTILLAKEKRHSGTGLGKKGSMEDVPRNQKKEGPQRLWRHVERAGGEDRGFY